MLRIGQVDDLAGRPRAGDGAAVGRDRHRERLRVRRVIDDVPARVGFRGFTENFAVVTRRGEDVARGGYGEIPHPRGIEFADGSER